MPMFHGNALMASWGPCLAHGCDLRDRGGASRRPASSPDVRRFGATYFNYVGRSLSYVLAQPERPDERDNRLRMGFGTEASERDRAEFERRFGCALVESYGSSEGTCSHPAGARHARGRARAARRADARSRCSLPTATAVPAGPLLRRRPDAQRRTRRSARSSRPARRARFEGYYNNPDATRRARSAATTTGAATSPTATSDGWFWFAGRTADWLRVDSENFAAAPVERILARHPDVVGRGGLRRPRPAHRRPGDGDPRSCRPPVRGFDPDGVRGLPRRAGRPRHQVGAVASCASTADLPVTATRKVDKPALQAAAVERRRTRSSSGRRTATAR